MYFFYLSIVKIYEQRIVFNIQEWPDLQHRRKTPFLVHASYKCTIFFYTLKPADSIYPGFRSVSISSATITYFEM